MSEKEKGKYLFEEFPQTTTKEWEDKIFADLKGADYERKLIWRTNENFKVRPYYREEDLKNLEYLDVLPTEFPYVRGNDVEAHNWFIRQDIEVINYADANKKALDILNKGIDSLGFVIPQDLKCTEGDLKTLLADICLECIELNFVVGQRALEFVKLLKSTNLIAKMTGSFAFDPIMCLANYGKFNNPDPIADAKEVIEELKDYPNVKAITIWGDTFQNAGSSIGQELGYSLAVANEYLAKLTEAGVPPETVAQAIKFNFGVGSNYFLELAKVRSARLLWATIVGQYTQDKKSAVANIHAVTSDWNKTIYDPYVNMLRTQTEAMSAILGGVNSMTVKGFNTSYEKATDFSERIARNQQILLKEESHFDKVVDPGAGSYFIENLTDNIAEQACNIFLEVENNDGFISVFKKGMVQEAIKAIANKRDLDIANRKENLLGVNQFPNFTEVKESALDSKLLSKQKVKGQDAEPLTLYRGAMDLESLRNKTDLFAGKNGRRPLAFMLTIGNLTMRKARAQFACNFFAVAGFAVQDNNGFETVDEGIKAAREAKADIIVICSSDDEYLTFAPEVKQKANKEITVVAGFPKAIMDDLKNSGIEHFIHVKSNLLETLGGFQKELGI